MIKISFSFTGRQAGAIGIIYPISVKYSVNTVSEAKSKLYEDYDSIRALKIQGCTQKEYDEAGFVEVENRFIRRKPHPETGTYTVNEQ